MAPTSSLPAQTRTLAVLVAFALLAPLASTTGCKPKNAETPAPVAVEPDPEPAEPDPVPVATPQELYAECEQRVEGPQSDGECTKDEDCATAGCGNEVCTTVAEKVNVMTTCEEKLCFKILDTCGCNEGRCTWSLKSEVPADHVPTAPGSALPPSLPSMTPKPDGMKTADPAGDEPAPEPAPEPEPE